MSEDWQPIETAPKDVCYNDMTVMLWGPSMGVGIGWWNDTCWVNDCYPDHCDSCEPTHWMPLPEPPVVAKPNLGHSIRVRD